jgi:transcriptional regulator with XRE-family HTH domain
MDMLKEAQNLLDLNQKELGVYIGVSQRTISNWFTGARQVPAYVAEMALRLAEVESEALDAGDPAPTDMYRWAVISSYGTDEWLTVCGSKADALREAEGQWSHMTEAEKAKAERFEVGLIHVQICSDGENCFSYSESNGVVDGDVYELAKDFIK